MEYNRQHVHGFLRITVIRLFIFMRLRKCRRIREKGKAHGITVFLSLNLSRLTLRAG